MLRARSETPQWPRCCRRRASSGRRCWGGAWRRCGGELCSLALQRIQALCCYTMCAFIKGALWFMCARSVLLSGPPPRPTPPAYAQVKSGVRALPPRGPQGSMPLAGKVPAGSAGQAAAEEQGRSWWFVGGLGARGLVYHAWLGKLVAAAVADGDESRLPPELLRWRGPS